MSIARPPRALLHAALAAALFAAPGCNNSNLPLAPNVPNTGSSLFSLSIEASTKYVAIGKSIALTAAGSDERGTPLDVTATWKSSDASVAKVDAAGKVSGVKKGKATITATTKSPAREATLEVTVLGAGETAPEGSVGSPFEPGADGLLTGDLGDDPSLDGSGAVPTGAPGPNGEVLSIYPATPRVAPGERIRLVALQGQAGVSAPAAAVWRTEDPTIATVDEAGVVTAMQAGTVTITASSVSYPGMNQQVRLDVIAPVSPAAISGIRIKPSKVSMSVGETFWLEAEIPTWTGGYDPLVRWESGDPSVATVSETGQVTAVGVGTTLVTAVSRGYTKGDLSAVVPIEVRNASYGGY